MSRTQYINRCPVCRMEYSTYKKEQKFCDEECEKFLKHFRGILKKSYQHYIHRKK